MDFLKITKDLLKGNFGDAFKTGTQDDGPGEILEPEGYRDGFYMFGDGTGKHKFFEYGTIESALNAFINCPPLQSIILKKSKAMANAQVWVMNKSGKGKDKESTSLFADKVRAKLDRPNPFQTGTQFLQMARVYIDIFGWCIIYPTYASRSYAKLGFSEASALWVLPPSVLRYETTGKLYYQRELSDVLQYIRITDHGLHIDLPLDEILLLRGDVPLLVGNGTEYTTADSNIFPDTKIRVLEQPINNIIGAYEARGELINYAGAQNLITPDDGGGQYVANALTATQEKEVLEKFKRRYGIRIKQHRNIISPRALKAQKLGTPTKDLMLFEEIEGDVQALCDQYGVPIKLLSNLKATSLNGTEETSLQRSWYQNDIIPATCDFWKQMEKGFKMAENNTRFDAEFGHVPALQANKLEAARAREVMGKAAWNDFKNGFITYNRALELLGEDSVTDGAVYYNEWSKRPENMVVNEQGVLTTLN